MKFYRYGIGSLAVNYPHRITIDLQEFELGEETPKGYWIKMPGLTMEFWRKWIPKTSRKRFAYPTKDEAMRNFRLRTKSRVKHLKNQLYACERALEQVPIITCNECEHTSCPMRGEIEAQNCGDFSYNKLTPQNK